MISDTTWVTDEVLETIKAEGIPTTKCKNNGDHVAFSDGSFAPFCGPVCREAYFSALGAGDATDVKDLKAMPFRPPVENDDWGRESHP